MITTTNVHGRDDWFCAMGEHDGRVYTEFGSTRQEAFMGVLWQLAEVLKLPV